MWKDIYGVLKPVVLGHAIITTSSRLFLMKLILNSSEVLMCGRGVRSILLFSLVARCIETIEVCNGACWFMSVLVTVWESVGIFVV